MSFSLPRRRWIWKRFNVAIAVISFLKVQGIRSKTIVRRLPVVEPEKLHGRGRR